MTSEPRLDPGIQHVRVKAGGGKEPVPLAG
jgi:hypothetical protein